MSTIRVLRSYEDRSGEKCNGTFNAVFGRASDTDTQHPLFKQQSVIGFPDGGAIAIPVTIPAGQTPVDVMITSGEAMVGGGNAHVKLNFSQKPGDYGTVLSGPPGGARAVLRVGDGPKQHHAYPEAKPGETWYLNAVADGGGKFWLVCNPTGH